MKIEKIIDHIRNRPYMSGVERSEQRKLQFQEVFTTEELTKLGFDNLNNDFTHDHMKEALPDLVRENYKFREDIIVEYAGSITPYIEKYKDSGADSIKGLIISGSFQTINDEFYIEYEAYDIHDWRQLTNRQLSCPIHDIICVHDNF